MPSTINLSYLPCSGPIDYRQALEGMCQTMGLDYALFAARLPGSAKTYFYSTYPLEWTCHYIENNLAAIDPVIGIATESVLPFDWQRLRDQENFKVLAQHRAKMDIPINGMTAPTHSPRGALSILSVCKATTDSEWTRHITPRIGQIMLCAAKLHEDIISHLDRGADLGPNGVVLGPPNLDTRHVEILNLLAEGKNLEEISASTGLSRRSTMIQIDHICALLDAINESHAVARAIGLGIVSAPLDADPKAADGKN